MKRRFLALVFVLALFAPIALSVYKPQQASAANGVQNTGNNLLQLLGEHCHDLDSIKHDFGISSNVPDGKGACHEDQGTVTQNGLGWEEVLANSLNCSSDMFYQHDFTDPNDSSVVTKTLWYTHLGDYKDCYLKAQSMFNNMTSTGANAQCVLAAEGSQNYTNCLADVSNLHDALGCSTDMLQKTGKKDSQGNYYYKIDPNSGAVKNCLQRIDDVGKVQIVIFGADGKTTLSANISDPSITPQSGDGPGANNQGADNSCEASGGGFSLNWALCEVYRGTQSVTDYVLNNIISPLLSSTPICLPGNSSCNDTIYVIWSHFRVYGDIFLVITLLVIVFGESIGGGMIEAYTAKKVLPRLLAAAILLNLSIYIMAFAIDLTNVIGGGIGQLITSPIPSSGSMFTIKPGSITAGAIFGTVAGAGLLAGAFAINVTGIALLLLGLAITGALAVLAVFVTLIIRQAIILGLVLISPVAFALWCLPNTEKWFKRWWDTFFQMLLVYPMVVVLFAVADVMSYLTAHNGNGGSYVNNIIAFLLLLIPLYLVPFTLRSSNRLMGAIQGATSNIARQINGATGRRALAGAGQQSSEKLRKTGNFEAMGNRNALFRGISTVGGAVANPRSLLRGRAGVRSTRQAKQITHGAEALKDNAIFQANQGDDKFLLAVANRGLAEQKLAKTQQKFEEARSRGDMAGMTSAQSTMDAQQHGLDAAAQLGATGRSTGVQHQALQALSRTGFQFDAGAEGYAELSDTARQLSRGDERAYSAIMNEAQYSLRTAQRFDLGGINDGAGYDPGAGVSKASLYELANAKPESIKGLMDSVDTNATRPTQQHAVVYKELQAMLPNAKGSVRDEIVRQVDNLEEFGVKDFLQQPTGATRAVMDPRTKQEVRVPETNDDAAQREARTYERPDPHHLGGDTPTID